MVTDTTNKPEPPERIWIEQRGLEKPFVYLARLDNKWPDNTEYIRASLLKSLLKDDKWLADNGLICQDQIFHCDKCGDSGVCHEFRGTFNHAVDCPCTDNPNSLYSFNRKIITGLP